MKHVVSKGIALVGCAVLAWALVPRQPWSMFLSVSMFAACCYAIDQQG